MFEVLLIQNDDLNSKPPNDIQIMRSTRGL